MEWAESDLDEIGLIMHEAGYHIRDVGED